MSATPARESPGAAPVPATLMLSPTKGRGTVWATEHRFNETQLSLIHI